MPLRERVERTFGLRIFRENHLPRGVDLGLDIARALPATRIETIFDVGANKGQSAEQYRKRYPGVDIFCFEPSVRTFDELVAAVGHMPRVRCVNCALGAHAGTGTLTHGAKSTQAALIVDAAPDAGAPSEQVRVETLDQYCTTNHVPRISFLKIDTEGHDLSVLDGSRRMLSEGVIDIVEVEAGMNPGNKLHVAFELLKARLESVGYLLFALYEQKDEWLSGEPHLRRTNAVFISESTIAANS